MFARLLSRRLLPQKRFPCSPGTFGVRAFGIEGSASFTIQSCSAFATGLVDCATKRLKPSSVIVVTDCTLPLVRTVARPRSCSGTSFGTLSVRMPRMRQTSLATIHLRPLLAKMWTDEGLMPVALKATVVVVWIAVAAMMLLTFDDLGSLNDGRKPHIRHGLSKVARHGLSKVARRVFEGARLAIHPHTSVTSDRASRRRAHRLRTSGREGDAVQGDPNVHRKPSSRISACSPPP
jgi:hypothetical protein